MREAKKGMAWYKSPDGRLNTYPDNLATFARLSKKGFVRTSPQDEKAGQQPPPIEQPLPKPAQIEQPLPPSNSPGPKLEITDNLQDLSIKELRELAKALNVDPSQKRADLETAIKAAKNV